MFLGFWGFRFMSFPVAIVVSLRVCGVLQLRKGDLLEKIDVLKHHVGKGLA